MNDIQIILIAIVATLAFAGYFVVVDRVRR
jgi:hypothetical protein